MRDRKKLVLLIDDDADDVFFHRRAILNSGLDCEIDVCTSGDHAMNYLSSQGEYATRHNEFKYPDLIFLDINMPRVNGWEFLELYSQWIADKDEKPSTIIVMLSTSLQTPDVERAETIPIVYRYVVKPLIPDVIRDIFDELFPTVPIADK